LEAVVSLLFLLLLLVLVLVLLVPSSKSPMPRAVGEPCLVPEFTNLPPGGSGGEKKKERREEGEGGIRRDGNNIENRARPDVCSW
jgi:hypothetical protein